MITKKDFKSEVDYIKNLQEVNRYRIFQRDVERELDKEELSRIVCDIEYTPEEDYSFTLYLYNPEFMERNDGFATHFWDGLSSDKVLCHVKNNLIPEVKDSEIRLSKEEYEEKVGIKITFADEE